MGGGGGGGIQTPNLWITMRRCCHNAPEAWTQVYCYLDKVIFLWATSWQSYPRPLSICTWFFQFTSLKYPAVFFSKFELDFLSVKFKFEISSQQNQKSQLGQLKMSYQSEKRWIFQRFYLFDSQQCSGCSESTRPETGNVYLCKLYVERE